MKCFKISGNFQQYGHWSHPDPGFIGHILVNDDGSLEGYMDEQYGSYDSLRFVTGIFLEKEKKLIFFKLGCSNRLAPLIYTFSNIDEEGAWNAFDFPNIVFCGIAKVNLEETDREPYLSKIQETRQKIINGPSWNKIFVNNMREALQTKIKEL